MTPRIVYRGFDKLNVTLHARVPEDLLRALIAGREAAEKDGGESTAWDVPGLDEPVEVYPKGIAGGYGLGFRVGGYEGVQAFLKRNPRPADGNVLIQPMAAGLVSHGYAGTRDRILALIERLGLSVFALKPNRVDYAVDVYAPAFALSPDHVIAPASVRRRHTVATRSEPDDSDAISIEQTARRVTGIRIGHRNGRQFAVYDKALEIRRKRLDHYRVVWDLPDPQPGEVWRFEARFGPVELRKKWGISGFADLEASFGDALGDFYGKYRVTTPNPRDSNIARWPDHPVFALAAAEANRMLSDWQSGLARGQPSQMAFDRKMHDAMHRGVSGLATLHIGAGKSEGEAAQNISRALADTSSEFRLGENAIRTRLERIGKTMAAELKKA
jgi:hypothetical protein